MFQLHKQTIIPSDENQGDHFLTDEDFPQHA